MKLYLKYPDNTYTDAADYESIPFDAPSGAEWIEGEPEGLPVKMPPVPIEVQLKNMITQGQALLASDPLPAATRLLVYQFETQATVAAQRGDLDVVLLIVNEFNPTGLTEAQSNIVGALKAQIEQLIQEARSNG
ncbi:MAG: hypothetical protein K2X01_11985 [Cyanobacteria bacterium]|nr:hypothetical protein [Cyanobacteriota bacterium]